MQSRFSITSYLPKIIGFPKKTYQKLRLIPDMEKGSAVARSLKSFIMAQDLQFFLRLIHDEQIVFLVPVLIFSGKKKFY